MLRESCPPCMPQMSGADADYQYHREPDSYPQDFGALGLRKSDVVHFIFFIIFFLHIELIPGGQRKAVSEIQKRFCLYYVDIDLGIPMARSPVFLEL